MISARAFRKHLLQWFEAYKRDLPWREHRDAYRIWVSEIMLQQTRVGAVLPYYEQFFERFPDIAALAGAEEPELLAAWAGLGYYQRARNLQKAARQIVERGGFPDDYKTIRELAGVGEYTAAAIASIAFNRPHAAVDGNVIRVLARVTEDAGEARSPATRARIQAVADELIDPERPGDFNQALMELGAMICGPRDPECQLCPIARWCGARASGRQREFPVKQSKPTALTVEERLLIIERAGRFLLWQRPADSARMPGFWELPRAAQLPRARIGRSLGQIRHTIVNTNYNLELRAASIRNAGAGFTWLSREEMRKLPLSTTAKKAFACLEE